MHTKMGVLKMFSVQPSDTGMQISFTCNVFCLFLEGARLREAEIPRLNHTACTHIYSEAQITEDMLCAGDDTKDTCQVSLNLSGDRIKIARLVIVPVTKYDFSYARHWHVAVDITMVRVSCDANHRTRVSVDNHHRATTGSFTRRVVARCFPRHPHDGHSF